MALETPSLLRQNQKISPFSTLWHCFALGAPLCVLLDLLGTPSLHTQEGWERGDNQLLEQEQLMKSFIDGIQLLEIQGKLPYGEVCRVEDLFQGTHQGFSKVRENCVEKRKKILLYHHRY